MFVCVLGPCSTPYNGDAVTNMQIWNSSQFLAFYVEGNYTKSYSDSYMQFYVTDYRGMVPGKTYSIYIDRSNGIKRTCAPNATRFNIYTI